MTDMKNYIDKLVAVRSYNDDDGDWKVSILKDILPNGHFVAQEMLSDKNYGTWYKYCRPLTQEERDRLL